MMQSLRCIIFVGFLLCAKEILADHEVVLVASSKSPITDINSLELRKIYLGITIRRQGKVVNGLRNASDNQLNRIFLQSIAAMSERSYQRRLLFITLKYGKPRPPVLMDQESLLKALAEDPYAITYMWREDVQALEGFDTLKILKTLWQE